MDSFTVFLEPEQLPEELMAELKIAFKEAREAYENNQTGMVLCQIQEIIFPNQGGRKQIKITGRFLDAEKSRKTLISFKGEEYYKKQVNEIAEQRKSEGLDV